MSKFIDYNPDKGVWHEEEYDHIENKVVIHTKQDVEPVLEYTKRLRNSGVNDKVGEFSHYAVIPVHVELALRKKGINIYSQHYTKELLKEINQNYPHLKVTNLKHDVK
tara:strand:+ start:940 stop:1263 length:324 start_codon:yes stop_codon:yes gene_type:complete